MVDPVIYCCSSQPLAAPRFFTDTCYVDSFLLALLLGLLYLSIGPSSLSLPSSICITHLLLSPDWLSKVFENLSCFHMNMYKSMSFEVLKC